MKVNLLSFLGLVVSFIALGLSIAALKQSMLTNGDAEKSQELAASDAAPVSAPASSTARPAGGAATAPKTGVETKSAALILPSQDAPATKEELEADAQSTVNLLLAKMPGDSRALHVSAMLNAQLHNTEEAITLWGRCIELDPQVEQYYVNLAAAALERGDGPLAITTLEKALQNGFASPDVLHHLSIARLNTGQASEAAKLAENTLLTYPQSGAMRLILGQAQLKLGELESAELNLRKAIELGVRSKSAYFSLFNVCTRLGKKEDAQQFQEIYTSFKEKEVDVNERFAVLSESEARSVCVTVLMEAANLYRTSKLNQEVEHHLLRVMALDASNRAACQELAQFYAREKQFAEELVARERLIKLEPVNLINYLLAARAAANTGNATQAEAFIKLAISLSPHTATGYAAMGEFLVEQQQPEKAVWYIQRAIAIVPSRSGFELLARALRASGRESDAQSADEAGRKIANN